MKRTTCTAVLLALMPTAALAADPPAAGWSIGRIQLSGLIDGYYSFGFNHPASRTSQLRNFEDQTNQFSLNMAKLVMEQTPEPLGFRLDLGFGRAFDIMHGASQEPAAFRPIEQIYVSYKPPAAGGLQFDFGKFVTASGAEVIETDANWNYSRSLLFALALPYHHFGLRATMPLGSHFSAGASLVNGWNNVNDNNSGKTLGLTGSFHISQLTWTHTYYTGPEKEGTNRGLRHLYDTVLLLNPAGRASMYLNFDYGVDRHAAGGSSRWVGVAGAARFALHSRLALAPRLAWFNDADGFATGAVQKLKETTLTAEFQVREGVLTRLEYRRDWSNQPYFDRGASPARSRHQDTLLLGLVAYFGPDR